MTNPKNFQKRHRGDKREIMRLQQELRHKGKALAKTKASLVLVQRGTT